MTVRQINAWLCFDEQKKQLQIDVPAILHTLGYPDTEVTRSQVTEIVLEIVRNEFPDIAHDLNTAEFGTKRVYNPTQK